jgi:hypothetical protein
MSKSVTPSQEVTVRYIDSAGFGVYTRSEVRVGVHHSGTQVPKQAMRQNTAAVVMM